jgi:hypothetical protein
VSDWPTATVPLIVAPLIVGALVNVYAFVAVTDPPAVVRTTFTAPAACAGVTTVTDVEVFDEIEVPEVPPNVIPVTPERFVPEIVKDVPPDVVPLVTDNEFIVGKEA